LTACYRDDVPRVAVIGAGISGLTCARKLTDHGVAVTVFEKSRGVGGRMATRRTADGLTFDHGAQYFTVSDERFRHYVDSWYNSGLVDNWKGAIRVLREGRVTPCENGLTRFVGTPGMTSVCKHLAGEVNVHLQCEITSLMSAGKSWRLIDATGRTLDTFDVIIVSAPSPQSATLLGPVSELGKLAEQVGMQPCWAVMAVFDLPLPTAFDGAFVYDSALSWVARNSSKPARSHDHECWVLHGSASWSQEHLEETAEEVGTGLIQEFFRVVGLPSVSPKSVVAHRWRYAMPLAPLKDRCLFDPASGLGACGDWCFGPRVEGAFLSGNALASRVLREFRLVS